MVDDDRLDDLVNVGLAGHGVLLIWYGHQRGTKANSQVVGVHHVLVAVLRKTAEREIEPLPSDRHLMLDPMPCGHVLIQERKQVSHDDDDGPLKGHDYLVKLMSSFYARVEL